MPTFRQYPQASSIQPTDAFVIDRVGQGTMYITDNNLLGSVAFPPLAAAPANPSVGTAYYDTTLGYPRIYGSDLVWHGFILS
jgi:hypothetical protein